MTNLARSERLALCQTLEQAGPDAPTLCEGWTARDLAAHLVTRERRPDAQIAMLVPPLAEHAARVQAGLAAVAWTDLVRRVHDGPPVWHPTRLPLLDAAVNTAEFWVHHEDVRRAQPGWKPRPSPLADQRQLWHACGTVARLALRSSPVGVVLTAPDFGRKPVHRGEPAVEVVGPPGELLLFALGRRDVAEVRLHGDDDAVAALQRSSTAI
jgi:uncharacterized protein (TIGR03085 family)